MTADTNTEFLLARIADDEVGARSLLRAKVPTGIYDSLNRVVWSSDLARRVLAECEAKRRIVRERNDEGDLQIVLQHPASVYADHPDYDEA